MLHYPRKVTLSSGHPNISYWRSLALLILLALLCGYSHGADKINAYTANDGKLELLAQFNFVPTNKPASDGKLPGEFRIRVFLRNLSDRDVSVVTSTRNPFSFTNKVFWFYYRVPMLEGRLVRDKPSIIDVTTLKPNEIVALGEARGDSVDLKIEESPIEVRYMIEKEATKLYNVWAGELVVAIPLKGLGNLHEQRPTK